MTHATPIRPVKQIYHTCMCPHCEHRMWPDGSCTNCNYDYAIDEFSKPLMGVALILTGFSAVACAAIWVAL